MAKSKYDIFISYRRSSGAQYARILQLMLNQRGYTTFLDYDEIKDGFFNEKIQNAIQESPIFLIILSEGSLDRCINEDDSVRKELSLAFDSRKKIIPVNPDNSFKGVNNSECVDVVQNVLQLEFSDIYFGQALGVTVDQMIRNRIEPIIGRRIPMAVRDEDFEAAKERLYKQGQRKRILNRINVVVIILIVGVFISGIFLYYKYNQAKGYQERLQALRSEIERRHAEFDPILRQNLTESQLNTIDTLFLKLRNIIPDTLWISQTEFTCGDWAAIMGEEIPLEAKQLPVTGKSYVEIITLLKDSLFDMTGVDFDLPSAEEWTYAAKGGKYNMTYIYAGSNNPDSVAWYSKNSMGKLHNTGVSGKIPNYLDLYDMSGNVAELCNSPYTDSNGKEYWIVCGGDYSSNANEVKIDAIKYLTIDGSDSKTGFRIVVRKE